MNIPNQIPRYSDNERLNHWLTAICFMLAALSGLSLFHPSLFWLTNLFGGGPSKSGAPTGGLVIQNHLYIDGKEITGVVTRQTKSTAART